MAAAMCAVAALGARVRGSGRDLQALSASAPEAAAVSACPACTAPRKAAVYHCPSADTKDPQFNCPFVLQKQASNMIGTWSAGRAVSFECDPNILQTAKAGQTMKGLRVSYTKEGGGRYDFDGFIAHDASITSRGGVVTMPIFDKGLSHHDGNLNLRVLATRAGYAATAEEFASWLSDIVTECTGDPATVGKDWRAVFAEAEKAVKGEANNFMSKAAATQRDHIRSVFAHSVVLQNGKRTLKCFRSNDAPALPEYKTVSELESNDGRGNERNFDEAYEIYEQQLAARIPTSASELQISLYIASMLELPVDAVSKKRGMTATWPGFFEWITLNGCKFVAN